MTKMTSEEITKKYSRLLNLQYRQYRRLLDEGVEEGKSNAEISKELKKMEEKHLRQQAEMKRTLDPTWSNLSRKEAVKRQRYEEGRSMTFQQLIEENPDDASDIEEVPQIDKLEDQFDEKFEKLLDRQKDETLKVARQYR